jgi:PTH1 family peptidyl-tRNA hydrolase
VAQGISLIVGLGNPGTEYTGTRHNAGFRFLDVISDAAGEPLRAEARFSAHVGKLSVSGKDVWLLAPQTFMNHSGDAVAKFTQYYKISTGEILIVHDDLDLPPGTVRLKVGGGDGGHNGLADVTAKLGTSDFARLRIGIGHPGIASQVTPYVLKKAPAAEQALVDTAIMNAKVHLAEIVHGEFQKVMNSLHMHK